MNFQRLYVVVFLALTFAVAAGAQDNLGENKGTGETRLRVGSWRLTRIETSAASFGQPRQSKSLPADTRERKGIFFGYGERRINAAFDFGDLKEIVTQSNGGVADASLNVHVKVSVTGKGVNSEVPKQDFTAFKCNFAFTSPSGNAYRSIRDYSWRQYQIYAGSYQPNGQPFSFSKSGEFTCGGTDMRPYLGSEEDFTLTYSLSFNENTFKAGYEGDVAFHFFYKWAGWQGTASTPGGATAGQTKIRPVVEEIPEGETIATNISTATNKARPKLEEIPDEIISPPSVTQPKVTNSQAAPQPKPQETPKPKKPSTGGDFWGNFGKALGDTIREGQNVPPAGGGNTGGSEVQVPTTGDLSGLWEVTETDAEDGSTLVWQVKLVLNYGNFDGWQGRGVVQSSTSAKSSKGGSMDPVAAVRSLGNGRISVSWGEGLVYGRSEEAVFNNSRFATRYTSWRRIQ